MDFTELIDRGQQSQLAPFDWNEWNQHHFVYAVILCPADDFSEIHRKWAGNNPAIIDQK